MKLFTPDYKYVIHPNEGIQVLIDGDLNEFNVNLLNIGDLKSPSRDIEVLSVVFDLEGFTNFTRQVDPQLAIPNFISEFFNWLFDRIKHYIKYKGKENTLWAELPFFSKFMGDGVLFLWKIDMDKIINIDKELNSEQLHEQIQNFLCNIITTMYDICNEFNDYFVEIMRKTYVDSPSKLRCGIARGNVFPIGNGLDYVGPCINISNRLQKFNNLSFAFSARGIDTNYLHETYGNDFVKKRASIRGIGDNELIYISEEEFINLSDDVKHNFTDV